MEAQQVNSLDDTDFKALSQCFNFGTQLEYQVSEPVWTILAFAWAQFATSRTFVGHICHKYKDILYKGHIRVFVRRDPKTAGERGVAILSKIFTEVVGLVA